MHYFDIHNRFSFVKALSAQRLTDNTVLTTDILDLQGYWGLELLIQLGTLADADATFAVTGAMSNDSGMAGSVAMTATDLLGTLAGVSFQFDDDNKAKVIGYKPSIYRYVQFTITPTANSGNADLSATYILRSKNYGTLS
jgi:hypothetical protein